VFASHFESVKIWRRRIDANVPAQALIRSSHWSCEPSWSRNGVRIAFVSDRTGFGEIWVTDEDGRHPQQWTFLKQARLGSPKWSPDGTRIAFTAPSDQGSSIYVIDSPGGQLRLVPGSQRAGYVDWSPDGRSLYFNSNRGGSTQIWRIGLETGSAEQVTHKGGRVPSVSFDGRWLYYLRMASTAGDQNLWRMPIDGGP
jgi:TolB protein